jgi:Sulfatase
MKIRYPKNLVFGWLELLFVSLAVGVADVASYYLKADGGSSVNADSLFPHEVFFVFLLMAVNASLVAAIAFGAYRRSRPQRLLMTVILSMMLLTFATRYELASGFTKAIAPVTLPEKLYVVLFLLVLGLAAWGFARLAWFMLAKMKFIRGNLPTLVNVMAWYLLVASILPVFNYLRSVHRQLAYVPPRLAVPTSATELVKPDIYYIVLDRYTNQTVLKDVLGFDNSSFLGRLRDNNFVVRPNAYGPYPYTSSSVGSTLNIDFLDDVARAARGDTRETQTALFELAARGTAVKAMKDLGYHYTAVGSWFGVSNSAPLADETLYDWSTLRVLGGRRNLGELETEVMRSSMYSYLFKTEQSSIVNKVASYTSQDHAELATYQIEQLQNLASSTAGGRFIFAHLLMPHDPYVFNADGSRSTYSETSENDGRSGAEKYTQQVAFINDQVLHVIDLIKKNSNNTALIVLQSDEGFYPQVLLGTPNGESQYDVQTGDMTKWSDEYLRAKYGVLAAYHLPGVPEPELKHITSTNIFRVILNNYFGYNLPYLPDCHFAYPEGRAKALTFTDITPRLKENPDPRCATVHDKAVSQPTHY